MQSENHGEKTPIQQEHTLVTLHTIGQIIGWTATKIGLVLYVLRGFNPQLLYYCLLCLRTVQTMQVLELVLALKGFTRTNPFLCLMQITGRLFYSYLILNLNTPLHAILMTLFSYTLSDLLRNLYYINKDSYIMPIVRYNMFIVLYPLGVLGEILSCGSFFEANYPKMLVLPRAIQAVTVVGFLILYLSMLRLRSKFYKSQKSTEKKE